MTEPKDFNFAPTEIDNQVSDFIKEISAQPLEPEAPANTEQAIVQAPDPETPSQNSVEDPTDRGLERLVAREVDLREREAKLSGASAEVEALRARLAELEPRALTPELLDKIKLSPADGLRALGLDPDEVVRTALMEKLGDKANTPEMRDMMEKVRIRKEMDALRAKVNDAERKQAAQAYYQTVDAGAKEYVKNTEMFAKHAPTVAEVAKRHPDRVHQEIMEEITRDASIRASREPGGDVISYQEAAMRVDKRWGAMRALLGTPETGTAASTTAPKTNVVAKTEVKTSPTTIKPPERPLAPWLQASKDEDEAIREAIAEFNKAR